MTDPQKKTDPKEEIAGKLVTSFYDQFALNQNHGQIIFIQFLSAILAVLIGYGYVYANTATYALLTDTKRVGATLILDSYAIIHLAAAYFVSALILTLLATVVCNIGYGFRRDQRVIEKIREIYLGDVNYKKLFGTVSFKSGGKNVVDFLPEFNRMFVFGILTLQTLLYFSFLYAVLHFKNSPYFGWPPFLAHFTYLIPLGWSLFVYFNYYKKYYWIMTDSRRFWLWDVFKRKPHE
jgi:hypothetical protein